MMLIVGPGRFRLGRVVRVLLVAFSTACGVPDYNVQTPTSVGGVSNAGGAGGASTTTSVGGRTSPIGGGGTVAIGGGTQANPFDCRDSSECSTFAATKICDTATNRCVECLPGVPAAECGAGLYC